MTFEVPESSYIIPTSEYLIHPFFPFCLRIFRARWGFRLSCMQGSLFSTANLSDAYLIIRPDRKTLRVEESFLLSHSPHNPGTEAYRIQDQYSKVQQNTYMQYKNKI